MVTVADVVRDTLENGGVTLDAGKGVYVTEGLVVGGVTESRKVPVAQLTEEVVRDTLAELAQFAPYVGTWVNEGIVWFDACNIYNNHNDALRVAIARNELAYFDLYNNWEIAVRPANMRRAA